MTSNVNEANFVLGPAQLYVAPFGTSEPTNPYDAPSVTWVNVGGTDGGVSIEFDQTVTDLQCDQVLLPVGGRVTAESVIVTASLSEITLANIIASLAGAAAVVTATGVSGNKSTLTPVTTTAATQPNYVALLIDGWAPRGASSGNVENRRLIIRKTLPQPKTQLMFDKKTQQAIATTFNAYFVSSSVAPWVIMDATD
jgi:hypothetical protein